MIANIAAMTREHCVASMGDIQQEMRQLREGKHRLSVADEASLSALQDDYDELAERVRRLDEKSRFAGGRDNAAGGGRIKFIPGDSGADAEGREEDYGRELHGADRGLRATALRTLDALVDSNRLPARAAEAVDQLTKVGPKGERDHAAQLAVALGDDNYLRAFSRLLSDPHRGHLLWSAKEGEAFRRVEQLRSERAMSITDVQGGHLIPLTLDPTLHISNSGSINGIRAAARTVQTLTDHWKGLTSAGVQSHWRAEAEEMDDDSPTIGEVTIPVHRADSFIPASYEVIQDAVNLTEEVAKLLVDGYLQLSNQAFTTGSGVGQPRGLVAALAAASPSVVVTSDGSEALAASDVYKLDNALAPRWQQTAQWVISGPVQNTLRQFETAGGQLKFPGLHDNPPTLLGRAVVTASNMDSTINPAATEGNHLVVLGDLSQFVIVDRWPSQIELIPQLFGPNRRPTGQRGWVLFARVGSDVLVTNAFRLLNVPTTA